MGLQLLTVPASKSRCAAFTIIILTSVFILSMGMTACGGIQINKPAEATSTTADTAVAPNISTQPQNSTVNTGQTATFTVAASGTGALSYQWQRNGVNIAGAAAASYTTSATTSADNGASFNVVVSNAAGETTSSAATLTVNTPAPPSLSAQPQSQTVPAGQTATFAVTANGTGSLNYQWRKNLAAIDGATGTSYTTPPATAADAGSNYDVVVSNAMGSVTSSAAALQVVTSATAQSYYVATNGNDSADGSQAAPFATLARAQAAMQASSIKMTQINAGTYYLTCPLALTSLDQGETWEPVPGATVMISGGQVLSGWVSEGNGIYSTTAPKPVGLDLEIAGVRQQPAALGYDPQRPFTSGWRLLPSVQASNFGTTFTVLPQDFTSSVKVGAIVQELDFLRYSDQFTTITAIDPATNSITVADQFNTGTNSTTATGSWRILNDPSDLGAAGEFAYDAASGKVYVEPVDASALNNGTVVAAQLTTLVTLNNVSNITITGLTFSDTKSDRFMYAGAFIDKLATIMATGMTNGSITGNTFVNVGNGIAFAASSNNTISGNTFAQVGGSGIFITGNSNHNRVTNNIMNGLGTINVGSTGVHIENSANNLVDSNTIDGSGRWGVDLYPSDGVSLVGNTVSNNVLRNTSQQTNDTGAIYSYAGNDSGYIAENTTITGNRIENMGGLLRDGNGQYVKGSTEAIYMDDQVSGVTMTNNLIEGDGAGMFLCHGCKSNSASNNVIVLQPAAYYDRGANGATYSTGNMTYNGTTRVDLLPSYFPTGLNTSTIVVRLTGQASNGTNAAFSLLADGAVIGTGTASSTTAEFVFTAQLAPHQSHRIGIALTNGASTGVSTTGLLNLGLLVNNTPVQLVAPEAAGGYGALGFVVGNDALPVTNFSATQNIVYRSAGEGQDVMDWMDWSQPTYVDPDPGSIDSNLLFQNLSTISDTVFGTQKTDTHSIIANPGFANAQAGDYTLAGNSPALALGFNPAGVPLQP